METKKTRFHINFDEIINENSFLDWEIKSSNNEEHSQYCLIQVPFHLRKYSQYLAENGTSQEIQEDRRKYSRFGPGRKEILIREIN